MDKNKYSYFLDQCNKTPLSKNWKSIFGQITEETIKQFKFRVENPQDFREALNFVELLNEYLRQPPKYFDSAYKEFLKQGRVPNAIRLVTDELLADSHLNILIAKERARLGISAKMGLKLKDPNIYGEYKLNKNEENAITRLTIYAALTTKTWQKFFSYLLLFNYVMPVTFLEIQDLIELAEPKNINRLTSQLFKKIKAKSLKKRQIDLLAQMSATSKEIVLSSVPCNNELENLDTKAGKITKSTLNSIFEEIYPKKHKLEKSFEAIKKRRSRIKNRVLQQLRKLQKDAQTISPTPPKIEIE